MLLNEKIIEKLHGVRATFEEFERRLEDPDLMSNLKKYHELLKQRADLLDIVSKFNSYEDLLTEISSTEGMIAQETNADMVELAQAELEDLKSKLDGLSEEILSLLLPKDPLDEKGIILEIRAGTGGDEAALFAADLFRMYSRYAERYNWKVELLSSNPTGMGGFKEIILSMSGKDCYSWLKHESGVHRVQRVPATEASGRIHTSTVTVAVLPEVEEVEIDVNPEELRIDTFCSSGPGGQSVNTTYSAVRITHIPTGLVVSCQDEKSQIKNKAKAMKVLRARLMKIEVEKQQSEIAQQRKSQVGTGDRSEKIKTYNFAQNRVSDHRIGVTSYNLNLYLDGDIEDMLSKMRTFDTAERLKNMF